MSNARCAPNAVPSGERASTMPSVTSSTRSPGSRAIRPLEGNSASVKIPSGMPRSEEHTSELQSPCNLVCRLLLEKKNNKYHTHDYAPQDLLAESPNLIFPVDMLCSQCVSAHNPLSFPSSTILRASRHHLTSRPLS